MGKAPHLVAEGGRAAYSPRLVVAKLLPKARCAEAGGSPGQDLALRKVSGVCALARKTAWALGDVQSSLGG